MADTTDLIEKIIDLKINAAVAAVMGEVQKVAQAYTGLSERVGPLIDEFNQRKAAEEQDKDARIKALEAEVARLDALARAPAEE